jgi:hypothetical protein
MAQRSRLASWPVIFAATIVCVGLLALGPQSLLGQNNSSGSRESWRIEVVESSGRGQPGPALRFAPGPDGQATQLRLEPSQTAAVSPQGTLAATLSFARFGQSHAEVAIYDRSGTLLRTLSAAPLDKIAIADDGRLAMYGFEPTQHEATRARLQFYAGDGSPIASLRGPFGSAHVGIFSRSGEVFIWLADEDANMTDPHPVVIMMFDRQFHETGRRRFEDWPRYEPLRAPEIDENAKVVRVHRARGIGTRLVEEIVSLDWTGRIVERRPE